MDDFSDDGFDDLNDTTLQELEYNAIQSTQAPKPNQTQLDNDDYGFEDDDLDDAVVIDAAAHLPVRHATDRPAAVPVAAPSLAQPARVVQQPRWQQSATTAASKPPAQYRNAQPPSFPSSRPSNVLPSRPPMSQRMGPPPAPTSNRFAPSQQLNAGYARPPPPPATSYRQSYQQSQAPQTQQPRDLTQVDNDVVANLQARVRALENDLNSAKGEASIVRSKYDKSIAAHEAEITRLKKQNAEALAKQERLVEAAIHAEKTAATELQFTRQDLREELQKSKKQRVEASESGTSTPKKNRQNGWRNVADGFDDVEILPSPSRAQGGAKGKGKSTVILSGDRTPSRPKRKRPALESPGTALEVENDVVMADAESPTRVELAATSASILKPSALPYDLLRLVLDHGAIHNQPLTFDLLARYSFPTDPDQSFAGIIFQKLPSLGDPHEPIRLLIDFCDMIIDLWDQCLREKYYEPIYDLVALITFILQLNTVFVAPYIASTLIPVANTTMFLLAVPRFESLDGDLSTSPDEVKEHLLLNIDTQGTLQLMYLTALGCVDSYLLDPEHPMDLGPARDPPQRLYWKAMEIDLVFAMLSPKQPREDFLGMLDLLCTSCLPDSIGPITGEPQRDPVVVANVLIDRVSQIMREPLRWAPPEEESGSYARQQCVVRLAALRTLMAFAQSPLGAKQMALSEVAIPRLVNVLCGAIDALYDMDVPAELFWEDLEEDVSKLTEHEKPPAQSSQMQGIAKEGEEYPAGGSESAVSSPEETTMLRSPTPLLYTIVSSTILLLHTLVTDPSTSAVTDMRAKLSTSHCSSQKYLLTLSRVNFAEEDLVLEAGIDPGIFERANDLLDLAVTPDEAEGVREVFGGG